MCKVGKTYCPPRRADHGGSNGADEQLNVPQCDRELKHLVLHSIEIMRPFGEVLPRAGDAENSIHAETWLGGGSGQVDGAAADLVRARRESISGASAAPLGRAKARSRHGHAGARSWEGRGSGCEAGRPRREG